MTHITHLFNDLVYCDYVKNRLKAPDITPASWKKVYGPEVDLMEAQFQADQAIEKAPA